MLDPNGHVATWNPGAEHVHGHAAADIIGRRFDTFYGHESIARGEPARHLAEAKARGQVEYEGWRMRSDGSQFWADVVLTACFDDRGVLRGYGEVTRDASDRRQQQAALVHQTLHDPLTGLGNRTLVLERLDHARTRLTRRHGVLTLLFVDLDRFKLVNDTMGHDVGDELLVQAAGLLRAAVRPEDTVVRFGGDELVVLCEDVGTARTSRPSPGG